jgi:hypothetical protein
MIIILNLYEQQQKYARYFTCPQVRWNYETLHCKLFKLSTHTKKRIGLTERAPLVQFPILDEEFADKWVMDNCGAHLPIEHRVDMQTRSTF